MAVAGIGVGPRGMLNMGLATIVDLVTVVVVVVDDSSEAVLEVAG